MDGISSHVDWITGHMDGIRKFRTSFMEAFVLTDKWTRKDSREWPAHYAYN